VLAPSRCARIAWREPNSDHRAPSVVGWLCAGDSGSAGPASSTALPPPLSAIYAAPPPAGAVSTSSETTLSSSSHPSKRSGSPPSIAAVPASGWMPSIQTRISTTAAPQRSIDRHRGSFPLWEILTALVAFIWRARFFRLGTDGPGSTIPADRCVRIGGVRAIAAGPYRRGEMPPEGGVVAGQIGHCRAAGPGYVPPGPFAVGCCPAVAAAQPHCLCQLPHQKVQLGSYLGGAGKVVECIRLLPLSA